MAIQPALGDVSCDLHDVATANLTDGWREVLARTYTFGFAVQAAPEPGEAFSASTSRWQLGSLALVQTAHDRGDGRRGRAEIAASDPDLVGLLYMRRGTIGMDFEGKPAALRDGQLVMWDTARRGGFTTLGRVDNQTLVIPRERLAMEAPGYEAMFGQPFRSDHPAARLIGSFLGSLMPLVSSLDVAARDAVADAALDIARAVVATRDDPQPRPQTTAQLMAVRLYIDANLRDPSLSPATIANANAISLRTLHRLFECTDDTVGAVIRNRRLSRCHADLLRATDESVTAIAYRWGFRNVSFFSRLFRERYGVSARELQMTARAAARPQM
ncbi:MAG: helix-turn-helix domain-containing protein [Solirubrobacterales bacterium]|nr:helix-turn-helix domain-containing protein [Solirubrobacterales bacterium]